LRLSIARVELPDGVHFEQYVRRMPKAAIMVVLDAGERGPKAGSDSRRAAKQPCVSLIKASPWASMTADSETSAALGLCDLHPLLGPQPDEVGFDDVDTRGCASPRRVIAGVAAAA
jgi:hypothetical protein